MCEDILRNSFKIVLARWSATHGPRATSGHFFPARHLTLDWHYITLQLTNRATNLWNQNFSSNPLLTATRNIYCQVENIKICWLMRNWLYHYWEERMFVNNIFSKMKYTRSYLRTKLRDDHLDDVFLLSSINISPDLERLSPY